MSIYGVLFDIILDWLPPFLFRRLNPEEKLRPISLDEMVKKSKLIVAGEVVGIKTLPRKNPKESPFDEAAIAAVEIEQTIAGSFEGKRADITYYPHLTFEARFAMGERCIFFIDEGNQIVKGYAGKIPIERDRVWVYWILDEPKNQTLKGFTQKIKDCTPKQGAISDKPGSR